MQKFNERAFSNELDRLRTRLASQDALADENREQRVERARSGFEYFCQTYFAHHLSLDGQTRTDPSGLHTWIWDQAPAWGPGTRIALAAPRGNAKTTYMARLYVIWRVVREDCWFPVIIQETVEGAEQSLEVIKMELEENSRLAADFPHICGVGRTWNQGEIVTGNGRKIKVFGAGKKIRGANYLGHRPDLIILDDLENDENVRSKKQRDKLELWFKRAILKLGPPDNSAQYIYIGTVLHYDAVLLRIANRPDFQFTRFKAVVHFPVNMDLWDRWERILAADEDAAQAFYNERKHEMDAGAKVLWPSVQPLYLLMVERAADRTAFGSEMQNEPLDPDNQIFPQDKFTWFADMPELRVTAGAVDPALGKTRGDYTAVVVLGRDADGYIYVLEADIGKYGAHKTIDLIIKYQRKWGCFRWAIEAVAYQELLLTLLQTAAREQRTPVPAIPVRPKAAKEIRIESLEPHVKSGLIRFDRRHGLLSDQLQEYPMGAHDDGPDALEMAFKIIHSSTPMSCRTPGGGLLNRLRRTMGRGY